jgi:arylsulfatase A-like enzyme
MSQPINVLFITADQWRGECLSMLGHPVVKTPTLDALATESVTFTNHFAQCSPCGPSRASLLTGTYLMNNRVLRNGTPLDARFTNIALEARKAGYAPALIGYTDTGTDPRGYRYDDPAFEYGYEGVMPGFEPLALMRTQPADWVRWLAAKGYDVPERPYDAFMPAGGHRAIGGFAPYDAPATYRAEHSDTAFCADTAIGFIEKQTGPWFLHLGFLRPHPPYIAPEPYNRMYDPASVPAFRRHATVGEESAQHPFLAFCHSERSTMRGIRSVADMSDGDLRKLRATYYGLMTEVDHQLGRVLAALRESGQYDRTLIVFTSDHGDMLGDRWLVGKECFFDPAFYIPLMVRMPGKAWDKARGRRVDDFTENVDIMPTILDLMGAEVPTQCDGYSLRPFLNGDAPETWRDAVHWEFDFRDVDDESPETRFALGFEQCGLAVIRDRKYKYVHFAGLPALFFDIEKDPHELNDLAGDPASAPRVLEYAQKLLSLRMTHMDRTLTGLKIVLGRVVELARPRR